MKKLNLNQMKKSKDILLALKKYGVMSRKTLQKVVPDIKKERNFRNYLKNLCQKQLIVKRLENINGSVGVFYQLNQSEKIREILAQYLGCDLNQLRQREYRYKELFHEQTAILIAYYLNTNFPDAIVLREQELPQSAEAQKVIPNLELMDQLKPDVSMLLSDITKTKIISIAFEFERSVKTKNRLLNKLKFYTAQTHIDGVVYIGSADRIINNLTEIYDSKILEKAVRIKHYGKNFLLTTLWKSDAEKSFDLLKNRNENHYSLMNYVAQLQQNSNRLRTDKNFEIASTVCMDD